MHLCFFVCFLCGYYGDGDDVQLEIPPTRCSFSGRSFFCFAGSRQDTGKATQKGQGDAKRARRRKKSKAKQKEQGVVFFRSLFVHFDRPPSLSRKEGSAHVGSPHLIRVRNPPKGYPTPHNGGSAAPWCENHVKNATAPSAVMIV